MKNPFSSKNPYDFLNSAVYIKDFITSDIVKYFLSSIEIDAIQIENIVNNYLGIGTAYNLHENKFIVDNNITIEITTNSFEKAKFTSLAQNKYIYCRFD
jgi:hypothetical protein